VALLHAARNRVRVAVAFRLWLVVDMKCVSGKAELVDARYFTYGPLMMMLFDLSFLERKAGNATGARRPACCNVIFCVFGHGRSRSTCVV
jgi:hypothetical protein